MKTLVVHVDLNPCGGAERVAIATIQALAEMGMDIHLAAARQPDLNRLAYAFGEHYTEHLSKIRTNINFAYDSSISYDLIINTHGDMLPYFREDTKKPPVIVYCHFPLAKYIIESGDSKYISTVQAFNKINPIDNTNGTEVGIADNQMDYKTSSSHLEKIYEKMLKNCTIVTNSEFSNRTILKRFGISATVVSPPVDVDKFRNSCLKSEVRDNTDTILVVSRIHPSKKIENAIKLAALLKADKIGDKMIIVGNLDPDLAGYHLYLQHLVKRYNLTDYIQFETNASFSRLLQLMVESKLYFHTLPGEPFGISTAEAMSAGLIPVIPDLGGSIEFVPQEYQFHYFDEAVELISCSFDKQQSERERLSMLIGKFSISNYIHNIKQIVRNSR